MVFLAFMLKNGFHFTDKQGMRYCWGLLILFIAGAIALFNSCHQGLAGRSNIIGSIEGDVPIDGGGDTLTTQKEIQVQEKDDPTKNNYFPYDLQLDTMAFLNCDDKGKRGFIFKAGAYFPKSGLRLSKYFLKQALDPKIKDDALEKLINQSTKLYAFPQLHFARHNNLMGPINPVSLNPLNKEVSELVKNKKSRIQDIRGRTIEFVMKQDPIITIPRVNDARLVLFYRNPKDNNSGIYNTKNNDYISQDDFYGQVYQLDFIEEYNDSYILNNVSETKYPTHKEGNKWECPSELQFVVRRHHDYIKNFIPDDGENDDVQQLGDKEKGCKDSSADEDKLQIVKQVLPTGWNINIEKKCISPQKTNYICYDDLTRILRGQIDNLHKTGKYPRVLKNSGCTARGEGSNENQYQICPRYLSICVRKQS